MPVCEWVFLPFEIFCPSWREVSSIAVVWSHLDKIEGVVELIPEAGRVNFGCSFT